MFNLICTTTLKRQKDQFQDNLQQVYVEMFQQRTILELKREKRVAFTIFELIRVAVDVFK